jgi:xanthine/uracil permease
MQVLEPERETGDRSSEWFVPKAGPRRLRVMVGLLFLPYTGMVISFAVTGSLLARYLYWDRIVSVAVIYFLGLGIGAHALDAFGSKEAKPWGRVFTKGQLLLTAILSLAAAYGIAIYYMVLYVPWLAIIAAVEGFFVFAYNLEWFGGRFHKDRWFAFSWGFLPVLAGYMMQTDRISAEALAVALAMALFSLVEIKASRPYKELKSRSRILNERERRVMATYESILKSISLGVICLGVGLLILRIAVL